MRSRFNRPTGSSRPTRPMDWVSGELNEVQVGATAFCQWLVLPSYLKENFTDPTAMALRVWATASMTGAGITDAIAGVGIIAWDSVSDATPAPCPGPLTNPELDWMWLWKVPVTGTTPNTTFYNDRCDSDRGSKARRKLGNQTSLLIVVQSLVLDFRYHIHARALIKE